MSHHYILEHICLPCEVCTYVSSLYSQLNGFIATKEWRTNPFPIQWGGRGFHFEESVNLHTVSWARAKGNGKWFYQKSLTPTVVGAPLPNSQRLMLSEPHSVKCFADDLTIISQHEREHTAALLSLSEKCSDIDLQICPVKCVSVVLCQLYTLDPKLRRTVLFPLVECTQGI